MDQTIPANQLRWLYLFIAAAVAVNFSGLFVTLMAPDATLYATIAKTMVLRHDYMNLVLDGHDWLDKPHFPFWVAALSFNIFGFTTWAYKLPAVLFLMMGAVYTYQFAKSLYNKQIALWAVLILLTAEQLVISNNDVRAEPYLTGLIIAAVYHFYKAYTRNSWHLLAGCIFTACAVMTKGMFVVIPVGGAIAGHLIITKQWNKLFNWRWLVAMVFTMLLILPELYCLYEQFDLHPEKIVFGQKGVSGIGFFFWGSQFGRFFNTGPIKGGGDPTFFIHTTLWAFLPWSLLLFAAVFQSIKKGIKDVQANEWYCLCGGLLTFLVFSASKFQLPFYTNIIYPFFAIITAQYLFNVQQERSMKAIRITQLVVIGLVIIILGLLEYFFVPDHFKIPVIALICAMYVALVFVPDAISNNVLQKVLFSTLILSFIINLYLNLAFYPSLVQYQAGSMAGQYLNNFNVKKYPMMLYKQNNWPLEFYLDMPVQVIDPDTIKTPPTNTFMLYIAADQLKELDKKGWSYNQVYSINDYTITRLKPAFLNVRTRAKMLTNMLVVTVNQPVQHVSLKNKRPSSH
jgi:4-amino-4-deoxy-L-arabinose transferase-like glycosyltransferase